MALALVLPLAACSGGTGAVGEASTTSTGQTAGSTTTLPPESTTLLPATTTTTRPLVGVSADFARTVVELDGVARTVAVADTNEQRVQGLMGVEDLDPLFGMLFVFESASVRSFWMKDTLIPLDIAFFDSSGAFVTKTTMEPCRVDDCPTYSSERAARYALEAPQGALDGVAEGSRLVLIEAIDGSGKEI
ncbi:MAG: DUF192 domain-containing protein [Acidimicrobiia bacterium]|nr:DUF192 domain-containing protein [Acidimicrobiia bacterium]